MNEADKRVLNAQSKKQSLKTGFKGRFSEEAETHLHLEEKGVFGAEQKTVWCILAME